MVRSSQALQLFRPVAALMPSVRRADRTIPFRQRAMYTGLSVSVFLVCSHLPLYGTNFTYSAADPLYYVRTILASSRGTLMELGVAPIVTAGTVMQLLAGSGLLGRVDQSVREDRELMDAGRKALALVIAVGEAAAHVALGSYGAMGPFNSALIVLQLVSASAIVVFIEDLLEKGYGLRGASAVSLLAATSTCGKVMWHAFSPVTVNTGRGPEFEGLILAAVHRAFLGVDKLVATLLRQHLPNMTQLLATGVVMLTAVFLEGLRVPLPLRHTDGRRGRGATTTIIPIKLLYTSTMPVVLHSAVVSFLYMVSQLLHRGRFLCARLLGTWKEAVAVGGLAYYVTPPAGLAHVAADPAHAVVYVLLLLASCAMLSRAWVEASGSSAKHVTRQIAEQRLAVQGGREGDVYSKLKRYIPTAALLGGLCVGGLTILADMTGAIGSGTGILLAATTVYNLVDNFKKQD
ncbi:hypothetical protein PR202_gb00081 [Eleusine coracana subsp. coracana]|uniref:Translocon Sec61/SecY plug domain-containing protein n=1 Tax=Eleusine coracana subsp. coracana TaxID=191504 RepID=A0AAV5DSM5_ELECO|nr:hypothetical protein QOZ80_5BG0435270 [Eleusine coracana subsp. coracana]GJN13387.1 hypothetical protein PR202_gb00081 [Eleusine coracana subsp. coracana]